LRFDDPAYLTIKRILEHDLDAKEPPVLAASQPPTMTFARKAEELVGHLMGGASWR
jgi:hypothetical protein